MKNIIRSLYTLFIVILATIITAAQNVGIGTSTPHASSILELNANDRGFLPPRLTTAQRNAIAAPAEGLVIYNLTVHCLEYFDGTVWQTLCGTAAIPPCSFTQSLVLDTVRVLQASSGTESVVLAIVSGSPGNMTTAITGMPAGVTIGSISNNPTAIGATQVVSINVAITTVPGNYTLTVQTTTASCGNSTRTFVLQVTPPSCQAFTYTGADQCWIVPGGVTSITVKVWGAGGGGRCGYNGGGAGSQGGGGGAFVTTTLAVTPGESICVKVGGGGLATGAGGWPNGGAGGAGSWRGFGGGGMSAIYRGATPLAIAGGGGGAGNRCSGAGGGGPGGGPNGGAGLAGTAAGNTPGGGGTAAAGGAAGTGPGTPVPTAGVALLGGNGGAASGTAGGGGGGGGGYYGGGGGGGTSTSSGGAGGGGGSSYATGTGTVITGGSQNIPGGIADPNYTGTYGYGGQYDGPTDGRPGYVRICW